MNTIIMNQDVLKSAISRRDNRSELPLSSRAFYRYRCHLAYLEDSNATGSYRRLSHCRFSYTALYCQSHSPSYRYAAKIYLLDCHPALRALRSTVL